MPTKKFLPEPDFSRDYESPDEEPEDPSLSGGLNPTESDEHFERHSVRSDSEEEDEEGEKYGKNSNYFFNPSREILN